MAMPQVLVIEDNPLNMELVEGVLSTLVCRVVPAHSAEEGLILARTSRPDVILLDMRLPGMSGLEAIRQIRDDALLGDVPVVAISAQAMHGAESAALRAGFDAYLSKPIDNRKLRELVSGYLVSGDG